MGWFNRQLPGPSKGCQLNPKGWWIDTLKEPFGTPLKVLVEGICHAYLKQTRRCFFQKTPVESARSVSPKVPFEVPSAAGREDFRAGGNEWEVSEQLLLLIFSFFFNGQMGIDSIIPFKRWTQEQVRKVFELLSKPIIFQGETKILAGTSEKGSLPAPSKGCQLNTKGWWPDNL